MTPLTYLWILYQETWWSLLLHTVSAVCSPHQKGSSDKTVLRRQYHQKSWKSRNQTINNNQYKTHVTFLIILVNVWVEMARGLEIRCFTYQQLTFSCCCSRGSCPGTISGRGRALWPGWKGQQKSRCSGAGWESLRTAARRTAGITDEVPS